MSEHDRQLMRLAVDEAKRSVAEDRTGRFPAPRVGAVLARDGQVLASAYRGEGGRSGAHAEYVLLEEKLAGVDVAGTQLYTTLEPCNKRSETKTPCANRIVAARGIETVWIGMYDPNPDIHREGWRLLRDAGIRLRDFDPDLRAELVAENVDFLDGYRYQTRDSVSLHDAAVWIPFNANNGNFTIEAAGHTFLTHWTECGADSIYAYDEVHNVAPADGAQDFDEIDDPSALPFTSRVVTVHEGAIVVYRDAARGYLLIKVIEVQAKSRGEAADKVRVTWQARSAQPSS